MTDPEVFRRPKPLDYDDYYVDPPLGAHVRRPRLAGELVCVVHTVEKPWDWRRGEWVRVTTVCGRGIKHHPGRRNCVTKDDVSCITCLASEPVGL